MNEGEQNRVLARLTAGDRFASEAKTTFFVQNFWGNRLVMDSVCERLRGHPSGADKHWITKGRHRCTSIPSGTGPSDCPVSCECYRRSAIICDRSTLHRALSRWGLRAASASARARKRGPVRCSLAGGREINCPKIQRYRARSADRSV